MKFNTTRKKLNKIYKTTQKNINNLFNKRNEELQLKNKVNFIKGSHIIYDSSWIDAISDDNVQLSYVDSSASSRQNALVPVKVSYSFAQDIEISEEYLNDLYVQVSTQSFPLVQFIESQAITSYQWSIDDYYRIKGDSDIIFQGYDMPTSSYGTQSFINSNDVTDIDKTGKVFHGTIKYTNFSGSYVFIGNIVNAKAVYNLNYNAGAGEYEYESFESMGFSTFSSGGFSGKGTHVKVTWVEVPGDPPTWVSQSVVTLNTQKSVLFEDSYLLQLSGELYENDVLVDTGTMNIGVTGLIPITSRNDVINSLDVSYSNYNSLFYSSAKATKCYINSSNILQNLPIQTNYAPWGFFGVLPYSQLRLEKNLDSLIEEETITELLNTDNNIRWIKINENLHRIIVNGHFYYLSPAVSPTSHSYNTINETYSKGGYPETYVWDGANRSTVNKTTYFPELFPISMRFLLIFKNKRNYSNTQKNIIREYL